jgi:site-specific DNA-methyltransferase (adenine-specific)
MGKQWDGGDIAFQYETWRLCFDLLPPGGHLLAFAGTRTYHRMACAIEEAGFEMRDTIAWLYGSGFPKSHNVSKGIDKAAGAERSEIVGTKLGRPGMAKDGSNQRNGFDDAFGGESTGNMPTDILAPATAAARQWDGWGTALKPAMELVCVARKPLVGTVAANVLAHGTGALNIDRCRIEAPEGLTSGGNKQSSPLHMDRDAGINRIVERSNGHDLGRWPANVAHDGSAEVVKAFPDTQSGDLSPHHTLRFSENGSMSGPNQARNPRADFGGDSGSAARFFYSSKADADDRLGSKHPTVKPVELMRWLVRLVTPPGGTVLDPFAGSGTTGMACMAEGFDCILVEREAEYVADIKARIAHVHGDDLPLFGGAMQIAAD